MRATAFAWVLLVATLAGCLSGDDAQADPEPFPDNAVSTDPDNLMAVLEVTLSGEYAPLDLVIDYGVRTTYDDVDWTLQMEDKARFTVFHMGSGGLEKLPGQRNITVHEGTYVVTMDVQAGNESSQAFATVTVEPDPDACGTPPEYLAVTAGGERHYLVDNGDEVWQESTGDDELQTPESCPSGPHDTRLK